MTSQTSQTSQTRFALIGDIHSQAAPLLDAIDFCQSRNLTPIFLGDLFDSRVSISDSARVYKAVKEATNQGAIVLRSNHQNKYERYVKGAKIKMSPSLKRTLDDFQEANIPLEEVLEWLETFPYGVCFRDSRGTEYRCAHAMFSQKVEVPANYSGVYHVMDVPKNIRDTMIYGGFRKDESVPGDGNRLFWWAMESSRNWVRVAGHYHRVFIDDKNIVLDGGIGDDVEGSSLCLWDIEEKSLHRFS